MPQGDKSSYTAKQKRKADHIEEGYKKRGVRSKEAARRAWATVNEQDGGARKKRSKSSGATTRSRGRKSAGPAKRSTRRASAARTRPAARARAAARSRRK